MNVKIFNLAEKIKEDKVILIAFKKEEEDQIRMEKAIREGDKKKTK